MSRTPVSLPLLELRLVLRPTLAPGLRNRCLSVWQKQGLKAFHNEQCVCVFKIHSLWYLDTVDGVHKAVLHDSSHGSCQHVCAGGYSLRQSFIVYFWLHRGRGLWGCSMQHRGKVLFPWQPRWQWPDKSPRFHQPAAQPSALNARCVHGRSPGHETVRFHSSRGRV